MHDIHTTFNDRNCFEVRSVYLDISKAFDKVWHEGLIFKLKQNGIEGKLLNPFQIYLTNRKQRVVLNGMEFNRGGIKAGVPQGSVLGPLLFLVYINDLEEGIKYSVKFFADDTSLFSIVRDPVITWFQLKELDHDLIRLDIFVEQISTTFRLFLPNLKILTRYPTIHSFVRMGKVVLHNFQVKRSKMYCHSSFLPKTLDVPSIMWLVYIV